MPDAPRPVSTELRREAEDGDRPTRRHGRRARGAARPLPGAQVAAHRSAALDRRAARRGARTRWAARERGAPGAGGADRRARLARSRSAELRARGWRTDRIDVTLPGDPPLPVGHLHLISQIRRRMEDIFVGLGFSVLEGPEIEYDYYNFTALNHPPEHPARLPQDTFYLAEQRAAAHAHLADAGARDGAAGAADLHRRAGARLPAGHAGRHARADVPPARGARDRRGHHARATSRACCSRSRAQMFGEGTEVRLRPGYFPFTEPSVEVDVSCFRCGGTGTAGRRRAARPAGARAGSRSSARGWWTRTCSGYVAGGRLRPRARPGLRVRDGHRADRDARAPGARPAHAVRERPAPAGAVRSRAVRVPLAWLRSYCDPGTPRRGDRRRAHDVPATKLERLDRVGVGDDGELRRRARARGRAAPGRRPAERVRRGRRVGRAAHDRLRRAERGGRPDGGGGAARRGHAGRHQAGRGQAARASTRAG